MFEQNTRQGLGRGCEDCEDAAPTVQQQRAGEEGAATDRAKNKRYYLPLQAEVRFKFISTTLQQAVTLTGCKER